MTIDNDHITQVRYPLLYIGSATFHLPHFLLHPRAMMSTAGGDDTAAQGNPSAAAHQPRAADNQNPTTATSNLVSPPPQQTPVPLRPLSPLRLTSPPPASQPAENNEQPSRNNEQSLAETLENDWDYVVLKKHHGTSKVYEHMQLCTLKDGVNHTDGCPAFFKKLIGLNRNKYMVCMICKDELDKPLANCLIKCSPSNTSNGTTHLNGLHGKYLEKLKQAKEEETKQKMKGKKKDKGSKKRKKDTSIDSFMSPAATSSSSMATKKSEYKKRVATETNQLIHEFVNNGAHPDTVVTNGDFRALIDHLIEHGQDLKGHYKHMGQRKYVDIEEAKFSDLMEQVSELIEETRDWYAERTGRRVRFISVSHDVWDGKRKKINGVSLFFVHPETLQVYRIPIGLAPPLGADSQKLFQTCKGALDRVNVEEEDIFRPVNDNCATAKKTGRLLLCDGDEEEQEEQPNGSCDMQHKIRRFSQ